MLFGHKECADILGWDWFNTLMFSYLQVCNYYPFQLSRYCSIYQFSSHAGTLGWMPCMYRTYPNLISSPPIFISLEMMVKFFQMIWKFLFDQLIFDLWLRICPSVVVVSHHPSTRQCWCPIRKWLFSDLTYYWTLSKLILSSFQTLFYNRMQFNHLNTGLDDWNTRYSG